MEVVVDPDGVEGAELVGGFGDTGHRLVLLDGVGDLSQVHPPALRREDAKSYAHAGSFPAQDATRERLREKCTAKRPCARHFRVTSMSHKRRLEYNVKAVRWVIV